MDKLDKAAAAAKDFYLRLSSLVSDHPHWTIAFWALSLAAVARVF